MYPEFCTLRIQHDRLLCECELFGLHSLINNANELTLKCNLCSIKQKRASERTYNSLGILRADSLEPDKILHSFKAIKQ